MIVAVLATCWAGVALAQQQSDADEMWRFLHEIEAGGPFSGKDSCSLADSSIPLVKPVIGRKGDGWPSQVRITGTVVGALPGVCGFGDHAASLRVRISESSKSLPSSELFVFTWCIDERKAPNYCGKQVRFTAVKLRDPQAWSGISASFDSHGAPYYVVADAETEIEFLSPDEDPARGDQAPNSTVQPSHSRVTPFAQGGKRRAAPRPAERGR
ncbi:MAG TPA: hypothetical protein VFV19_05830 [Candidatus Polarisedimenticolaceae bacterium]|nr:hypothetical protein [Candidatus Polarisedimenticolaceae bacterium]